MKRRPREPESVDGVNPFGLFDDPDRAVARRLQHDAARRRLVHHAPARRLRNLLDSISSRESFGLNADNGLFFREAIVVATLRRKP